MVLGAGRVVRRARERDARARSAWTCTTTRATTPQHSVSPFPTSGSTAVSWKRLNLRVGEYLARWDPDQPLFLYLNYGDTHFPYDHRELDDVLGVERLPRERISPDDPKGVFATYANAAANVDRGDRGAGRGRCARAPATARSR